MSLATGLYRPARWLYTRVRPGQLRALREDVELYRSLLTQAAVCFDIGANIGDKSDALLRAGSRQVIAFEPNARVIPELRARCGHDKRWKLVEAAVGRNAGMRTLYVHEAHGSSSFMRDWGGQSVAEEQVPVTTLDSVIEKFGVPDYVKIDTEGWEGEVLAGLTQRVRLVSFEFHLGGNGAQKARACLQRLREFGRASVNLTPAETSRFQFAEWWTLDEMIDWFPGDLGETLPGYPYGDLFVKAR
ncbi:MAG: FkbM family methyltransferase [Gemmatimonadota bacterium]|nr:FkbM family methyltransferase [Gemmatimonadota bacterium]